MASKGVVFDTFWSEKGYVFKEKYCRQHCSIHKGYDFGVLFGLKRIRFLMGKKNVILLHNTRDKEHLT